MLMGLSIYKIICQLWCIQLTIPSIFSSDIITGVVGRAVTLRCPEISSDDVINDGTLAVKEWFRGPDSNSNTRVANLMTNGVHVTHKYTVDERMEINSMAGDLSIKNLTLGDAGLYTCHFTGSTPQAIQLHVITGMFN